MAFSKYVITNAGRDLLLSCMANGDFRIEKLVLGSGRYSGIMTEIQDVVEPVRSFSEKELTVSRRGNQLEVRCRLSNEQLEQGFEWREYGLYATDGTKTVLYCYDNAGEDPVPITAASTGAGISNTIKLILGIDAAATVNVNFEPAPDFVLDDVIEADGLNAVTGAAVYAFVEEQLNALPETYPAGSITAGTLGGKVAANAEAVTDLSAAQLRNIVCGTADVADVLDSLNVGDIYFTVEEEA